MKISKSAKIAKVLESFVQKSRPLLVVFLIFTLSLSSFAQSLRGPLTCAALFAQKNESGIKAVKNYENVLDIVEKSLEDHEKWDIEHIKNEMKKALEPGLELTLAMQEFRSRLLPLLINNPERRETIIRLFEAELRLQSEVVLNTIQKSNNKYDFIIKGAGVYGALLAAELIKINPKWRILIVEAQDTVGSNFRLLGDMIRLNSSNKPTRFDERALPGEGDINRLPGLPIQVSDLDTSRFPSAKALGDSLVSAYYALSKMEGIDILLTTRGETLETTDDFSTVSLTRDSKEVARVIGYRTLSAPGLGKTKLPEAVLRYIAENPDAARSINGELPLISIYEDAIKQMAGSNVPLKLLADKKIGLAGGGDSGNTFAEIVSRLTSPAGMGNVQVGIASILFWFGQKADTCEKFLAAARSRYVELGHILRSTKNPSKVTLGAAMPEKVVGVRRAVDDREIIAILEDGSEFSVNHLVFASGSKPQAPFVDGVRYTYVRERTGSFGFTKVGIYDRRLKEFIVGPATGDLTNDEQKFNVVQNFVSIFNNAPRAIATAKKAARDYQNQFSQPPVQKIELVKTIPKKTADSGSTSFEIGNLEPIRTIRTANSLKYLETISALVRPALNVEALPPGGLKITFLFDAKTEKLIVKADSHDISELLSKLSMAKDFFNTIAMMLKGANGKAIVEMQLGPVGAKFSMIARDGESDISAAKKGKVRGVINGKNISASEGSVAGIDPSIAAGNPNSLIIFGNTATGKTEFSNLLNGDGSVFDEFRNDVLALDRIKSFSEAPIQGDRTRNVNPNLSSALGSGNLANAAKVVAPTVTRPAVLRREIPVVTGSTAKNQFELANGTNRFITLPGLNKFLLENFYNGDQPSSRPLYLMDFYNSSNTKVITHSFETTLSNVVAAPASIPQHAIVTEINGKNTLVPTYRAGARFNSPRFRTLLLDESYKANIVPENSQTSSLAIQKFVLSVETRFLGGEVSFALKGDGKEDQVYRLEDTFESKLSSRRFAAVTTAQALLKIRDSRVISVADARALLTVVSFVNNVTGRIDYTEAANVFMALLASRKIDPVQLGSALSQLFEDFFQPGRADSKEELDYTNLMRQKLQSQYTELNSPAKTSTGTQSNRVSIKVSVEKVNAGQEERGSILGQSFVVVKNTLGSKLIFVNANGNRIQTLTVPTGFDTVSTTTSGRIVTLSRNGDIVGIIELPTENNKTALRIIFDPPNFDLATSRIAFDIAGIQNRLKKIFSNSQLDAGKVFAEIEAVDKQNRVNLSEDIAKSDKLLTGEELVFLLKYLSLSDFFTGTGTLKDRLSVLTVVLRKNRISLEELNKVSGRIIDECFSPESQNLKIGDNATTLRALRDRRVEVSQLLGAAKRRFVNRLSEATAKASLNAAAQNGPAGSSKIVKVLSVEKSEYSNFIAGNGLMTLRQFRFQDTQYRVWKGSDASGNFISKIDFRALTETGRFKDNETFIEYEFKKPILKVEFFAANPNWVLVTIADGSKALMSKKNQELEPFILLSSSEIETLKASADRNFQETLQAKLLDNIASGLSIEEAFSSLVNSSGENSPSFIPAIRNISTANQFFILRRWITYSNLLSAKKDLQEGSKNQYKIERDAIESSITLKQFPRSELRSPEVQALIDARVISKEVAGIIAILSAPPVAAESSSRIRFGVATKLTASPAIKVVRQELFNNAGRPSLTGLGSEISTRSPDQSRLFSLRRIRGSLSFAEAESVAGLTSAFEGRALDVYDFPLDSNVPNGAPIVSISRFALSNEFLVAELVGGKTVLSRRNGKSYSVFDFRGEGQTEKIENKEIREFEASALNQIFGEGRAKEFGKNARAVEIEAKILIQRILKENISLTASDLIAVLKWVACDSFFSSGKIASNERLDIITTAISRGRVSKAALKEKVREIGWLLNFPEENVAKVLFL